MKNMYANEYATYSGYPAVTIKNFCKDGVLPYERIGSKYLINPELADPILLNRMMSKVNESPAIDCEKVVPITKNKNINFLEALKAAR